MLRDAALATLGAPPRRPPMTDLSRRNIIGAAAGGVMVAAASAPNALAAGGQPQSGPAPRPLAGKELPSFRFPLGKQPVKTYDGGWAKEATVAEFPVSEKLAGVLMEL
jgi:oxalate decarboxylase